MIQSAVLPMRNLTQWRSLRRYEALPRHVRDALLVHRHADELKSSLEKGRLAEAGDWLSLTRSSVQSTAESDALIVASVRDASLRPEQRSAWLALLASYASQSDGVVASALLKEHVAGIKAGELPTQARIDIAWLRHKLAVAAGGKESSDDLLSEAALVARVTAWLRRKLTAAAGREKYSDRALPKMTPAVSVLEAVKNGAIWNSWPAEYSVDETGAAVLFWEERGNWTNALAALEADRVPQRSEKLPAAYQFELTFFSLLKRALFAHYAGDSAKALATRRECFAMAAGERESAIALRLFDKVWFVALLAGDHKMTARAALASGRRFSRLREAHDGERLTAYCRAAESLAHLRRSRLVNRVLEQVRLGSGLHWWEGHVGSAAVALGLIASEDRAGDEVAVSRLGELLQGRLIRKRDLCSYNFDPALAVMMSRGRTDLAARCLGLLADYAALTSVDGQVVAALAKRQAAAVIDACKNDAAEADAAKLVELTESVAALIKAEHVLSQEGAKTPIDNIVTNVTSSLSVDLDGIRIMARVKKNLFLERDGKLNWAPYPQNHRNEH